MAKLFLLTTLLADYDGGMLRSARQQYERLDPTVREWDRMGRDGMGWIEHEHRLGKIRTEKKKKKQTA